MNSNFETTRILLLGETGSGKSTFINYLANFFLKGELSLINKYEKVRIVIPNKTIQKVTDNIGKNHENNVDDQTKSQTTESSTYKFDLDGKKYEIVDTPGFADTRRGQDEKNIADILMKASELNYITAIVLVINGSHARRTTTLKYVLNKLEGTVPDSLLKNLVLILTNCDENSCNFDLKLLKGLGDKYVFHMQNNAFSRSHQNKSDKAWKKLEFDWEESIRVIKHFIDCVNKLKCSSAGDFKKMIVLRQNLQCSANEIIMKQTKLFQVIDILEIRSKDAKIQNELAENNKNYKKKTEITVFELEKVDYFSTVCQTHFQEKICHEKCGLVYKSDTDNNHFISCAAHGGKGKCNQCECSMSIHYHTYTIPREKRTTVEKVINEMKVLYDDATSKKIKFEDEVQQHDVLKTRLISEVFNLKNILLQNCKDLKSICNNFNFHEELQAFIENLRKEASISRDFKKQKEFNNTADAIEHILNSKEFQQKSNTFQAASDESENYSE
jgi:hypothetical protein